MEIILLDTNVASLLHPKKAKAPELSLYAPLIADRILAVSFQTVAELLEWPERNDWGRANRQLLDDVVRPLLVMPYDRQLAEAWAKVMVAAERAGRRLEAGDGWVAATAVRYDLHLFTHDKDLAAHPIPGLNVTCLAP